MRFVLPYWIATLACLSPLCTTARLTAAGPAENALDNWPAWRGPLATGEAPRGNPPVRWSETENVRWKLALPGLGHSTPIVWENRIYVTAAIPIGKKLPPRYSQAPGAHDNLPVTQRQQFVVIAIDRRQGTKIWQRVVGEAMPHEGGHQTGSLASHSPITDGHNVYAFFGSQGLFCLDHSGAIRWKKELGTMRSKHGHGEGSSPALYGQTLFVNWDHEGDSRIVAVDTRTAKTIWESPRQEVTSWTSPIITMHRGQPQLIVSGSERIRSYDLKSGTVLWECGGLSANVVATPVAGQGMVFAGSSYETRALLAIRLEGARGDITESDHVAWRRIRGTPYVPSPLLYGQSLYFLRHYQGILSRVAIQSGKDEFGPFRLGGFNDIYASPVAANNRVYITDRSGATLVISHDDQPRALAANQLDDQFSASAAIVGNDLLLRGRQYLYCISHDQKSQDSATPQDESSRP
jgi:outer membrane protein assembly factor BamB